MYQNKADEARKEAERYKWMIRINIAKLDEVYTTKIYLLSCVIMNQRNEETDSEEFKVC